MNNNDNTSSSDHQQIDLGFGELFATSGDHIGHFYNSQENCKELLVPFLSKGLINGDKCVSICTKNSQQETLEALEENGLDVENALSSNQLIFSEGKTTPEEMREMLNECISEIPKKFKLLRWSGDMTWSLEKMPTTETLMKWESACNIIQNPPALFFCQYDLTKFLGSIIMDALKTHPLSIIGSSIHQNPFYQDPEEFLKELQSATVS